MNNYSINSQLFKNLFKDVFLKIRKWHTKVRNATTKRPPTTNLRSGKVPK
jgi:hypothetical protein